MFWQAECQTKIVTNSRVRRIFAWQFANRHCSREHFAKNFLLEIAADFGRMN
jgi:hypothetical protein